MSQGRERFPPLFDAVASFGNLVRAAHRAVRGKKHRTEARELLFGLEPVLIKLADELQAGSWRPGPYRVFRLLEPKERVIAAAPLSDRIVHHALCGVLEPLFEATSNFHSYACRPGKGAHAAVRQARHLARRYPYFLESDVSRFFDSVDHAVLKRLLAEIVPDARVLALMAKIIDHQPPGAVPGKGIPIGNLTSQYFANFYLGALDRAMTAGDGEGRYVRYMDDTLLFGTTKEELHETRAVAARVLRDELKLELKEKGTFVAPVSDGVPFLGLRIFRGTVRLKHASRSRFARGWRRNLADLTAGRITGEGFIASARSRAGHVIHANTFRLRTRLFDELESGVGA